MAFLDLGVDDARFQSLSVPVDLGGQLRVGALMHGRNPQRLVGKRYTCDSRGMDESVWTPAVIENTTVGICRPLPREEGELGCEVGRSLVLEGSD